MVTYVGTKRTSSTGAFGKKKNQIAICLQSRIRRQENLEERMLNRVCNKIDLQQRKGAARAVLGALEGGLHRVWRR
jgi:hypothetical protein